MLIGKANTRIRLNVYLQSCCQGIFHASILSAILCGLAATLGKMSASADLVLCS